MHRTTCAIATSTLALLVASPSARAATEPNTLVNPLVAPTTCVNCHNAPNAEIHLADPVYAPFATWQGSMMANSARDPVFWAGIAIASQDSGGGFGGETELCVRCHAPRAFLEGRGDVIAQSELQPNDIQGVECELCHRMVIDNSGSIGTGNAQYTIDDVVQGGIVPRRGPWAYEAADPYPPPHAWINDAAIGTANLCGTCHDVTTPRERVDDLGNPTGALFNEQRTFSEWFGSSYSQQGAQFRSCQDCHMPAVDDMAACVANTNLTSHPTGGRRHALAGANLFMLQVLDSLYGDGGTGEVASMYYQGTQAAVTDVLATAASLELDPPEAVELGAGLTGLGVTVTNNTGHKLPTGYSEGRVMWLEVIATYGDDVVYASGLPEHIDGSRADPLLRTYHGVAEQFSTGTRNHLLLNDHWVEDTRIPPLGSLPNPETDPVGDRYEQGPDGTWPNFDAFAYDFPAMPDIVDATPDDPTNDDLQVSVRLLYVINTAEYIEFLADANVTNEAGQQVADIFTLMGGSPAIVLAQQSATIPIGSFGPIAGTSSGAADTSGSASQSGTDGSGEGPIDPSTTTDDPTNAGASDSSGDGGAAGEDVDGCGCRSTGASFAPWSLVVVAALRRRRTRG